MYLNNLCIITEDKLEDSEIVEIVLDKENQSKNGDPDDSDKEELEIPRAGICTPKFGIRILYDSNF
ncbi:10538_t:CDS:2 [Cetraspora pellucida]|uniref:10538_t:CDS:1 n=1 Tax=Cetraspora pellucida TaxID=1433469 RepID=A0A9N9E8D3_9GLOM|nr:10538_t:CDS:2 [Cetraspora pellucida]